MKQQATTRATRTGGRPGLLPARPMQVLGGLIVGILALLPFHAFLTVWLAGYVGHYTALRLWKEVLVGATAVICLAMVMARMHPPGRLVTALRQRPLVILIGLYVVLISLGAVIGYVEGVAPLKATAYGWLLDIRGPAFLLLVWLLSVHTDSIRRHWKPLLLVPAAVTIGFGLLQFTVLPADFLGHFGYGPDTIPASATVDQKAGYQRIQSTLRGPNPFGAYLVLVFSALAVLAARSAGRRRIVWSVCSMVCLAALGMTYSRSALLGAVVAAAVLVWQTVGSGRGRQLLVLAAATMVLVGVGVGYGLRDNDVFQNAVFHTDEHSRSVTSSNQGHVSAGLEAVTDIAASPLGSGIGTAGPASIYTDTPRIAENYFLQLGQEAGIAGLLLYVAVTAVVARELWLRRGQALAATLLVSLTGLTVVNLLSHAWSDDTLAYVWWGLAGAAMLGAVPGRSIIKHKHEQHRPADQETA